MTMHTLKGRVNPSIPTPLEPKKELLSTTYKIPPKLQPLAREARQFDTAEAFEKGFALDIRRGIYYHITDNPDFKITASMGPRDMSSMAHGKMTPGKFMVTSDLDYWLANYPDRQYVAIIDMSYTPLKEYWQVNRGFGNEFFVNDTSKAIVLKVVPIEQAKRYDRDFRQTVHKYFGNKEMALHFFEVAKASKGHLKK